MLRTPVGQSETRHLPAAEFNGRGTSAPLSATSNGELFHNVIVLPNTPRHLYADTARGMVRHLGYAITASPMLGRRIWLHAAA